MIETGVVYNENCLLTMDFLPEKCVDLTVTSPPYDNLRKYKGYSFDFENIARGLFKITKIGGVLVWVVGDATRNGNESGTSFKQALFFKEIGFNLHDTMIYRKKNYSPQTHNRYEQCFEHMFVFSRGKVRTFNPIYVPCKEAGKITNWQRKGSNIKEGVFRRRDEFIKTKDTKLLGNVFEYPCGQSMTGHPAPFPEQLAADHITTWSNPGDIVYDPMAGSGTVPKMAEALGRKWFCSETSSEYCEIIHRRLKVTHMKK